MTHAVERDWRAAQRSLSETKALAIEETLEHLADLEVMFEKDGNGNVWDEIGADLRNLQSRLRSAQRDFEHDAGTVGG